MAHTIDHTKIDHNQVREQTKVIRDVKAKMQNVLDDFEASMRRVGADDVFAGDASETLGEQFARLKAKFEKFTTATEDFATNYDTASDKTQATDQAIKGKAEQTLNSDKL